MTFECRAVLFDLDGTLVDSLGAVHISWSRFCKLHDLDPEEVIPTIHGKRAADSIKRWLPNQNPDALNKVLRQMEVEDSSVVQPYPGALEFFESIPRLQRNIVTSGTRDVAWARLTAAGIPLRETYVTAEQVKRGKPFPDPFRLGALRIGVSPTECVAFEDTQAGIQAAKAAGCQTIGFQVAGGDATLEDWRQIRVNQRGSNLTIEF